MTGFDFLPWSVLAGVALAAAPAAVVASLRQARPVAGFAAGWWLALSLVLAAVDFTRPRYITPSYPLLAVPVALVLVAAARQPTGERWLRRILRGAGVVVTGLGVLLAVPGAFVDKRLALAGGVWMLGGTVAAAPRAATDGGTSIWKTLLGFAGLTILLLGTAETCIHPVFAPAAEPSTARRLLSLGPAGEQAIAIGLPENTAGKLRLASGGRLQLPELATTALAAPPPGHVVVVRARAAAELERRGWTVERAGTAYDRLGPVDVLESLLAPDREAWLAPRRRDLFIAFPPGLAPRQGGAGVDPRS
jgi:hypothetical protein